MCCRACLKTPIHYPDEFAPTPFRVHSQIHGFSHGLKSVHRTLFALLCRAGLSNPTFPSKTKRAIYSDDSFYFWRSRRDLNYCFRVYKAFRSSISWFCWSLMLIFCQFLFSPFSRQREKLREKSPSQVSHLATQEGEISIQFGICPYSIFAFSLALSQAALNLSKPNIAA